MPIHPTDDPQDTLACHRHPSTPPDPRAYLPDDYPWDNDPPPSIRGAALADRLEEIRAEMVDGEQTERGDGGGV